MSFRVADFLRSSHDNIHSLKASIHKKTSSTTSSRSPGRHAKRSNGNPTRTSSTESLSETTNTLRDHSLSSSTAPAVKTPESDKGQDKDKQKHRLTITGKLLTGGSSKQAKDLSQHTNVSLDWRIESGPAVMYETPDTSTGALVSGQLLLDVKESPFEVAKFDGKLEIQVTQKTPAAQKKPFWINCRDCAYEKTELRTWSFLTQPKVFEKGTHPIPVSFLLPGHLPATTDASLVSIQYVFTAEVIPTTGPPLKFSRGLNVRRSITVPDIPHHSLRTFPTTDVIARTYFSQVIHPIGVQKMDLCLEGLAKHNVKQKTIEYWKLQELCWRLEETVKTTAPVCEKHVGKDKDRKISPSQNKNRTERTHTRAVARGVQTEGWKANYLDGKVEMELEYAIPSNTRVVCDVKTRMRDHGSGEEANPPDVPTPVHVSHTLVIEMMVNEWFAPASNTRNMKPAGIGHTLKMKFPVQVTEQPGLGISWDLEAPPLYGDVPPSPPSYLSGLPPYEEHDTAAHERDENRNLIVGVECTTLNAGYVGGQRRSQEGGSSSSAREG